MAIWNYFQTHRERAAAEETKNIRGSDSRQLGHIKFSRRREREDSQCTHTHTHIPPRSPHNVFCCVFSAVCVCVVRQSPIQPQQQQRYKSASFRIYFCSLSLSLVGEEARSVRHSGQSASEKRRNDATRYKGERT